MDTIRILTAPPYSYIPEHRIHAAIAEAQSSAGKGLLCIAGAALAPRTTQVLAKLPAVAPCVVFLADHAAKYTATMEKALQYSVQQMPNGITVVLDGRYDTPAELAALLSDTLYHAPQYRAAITGPAGDLAGFHPDDPCAVSLAMLHSLPQPKAFALRNNTLPKDRILDLALQTCALDWLLVESSLQGATAVISEPAALQKDARAGRYRKEYAQRILDEEFHVLERGLRLFENRKHQALVPTSLAASYALHTKAIIRLFDQIRQGQSVSAKAVDSHAFGHALLALLHGETENARAVLETALSVISERPALIRLYKHITLHHPQAAPAPSSRPKISVVIPLFNQGHYLKDALHSVLGQTYGHWEVCIINDGSTDDSLHTAQALLEAHGDSRIRLLTQENRGKGATRNRGVRETDGTYICVLDADDLIAADYFAAATALLEEHPDAGWVTPKTLVFGNNNHLAWNEPFDLARSILMCPSPCSSLMRREAVTLVGLYREDLTDREDAELWLRLLEHGWHSITTSQPLFLYRHACQRPGTKDIFNLASKEEITSLHPWWYCRNFDITMREAFFREHAVYRFSEKFLNWDAINTMQPFVGNRKAFATAMQKLQALYTPVTKPARWKSTHTESYLDARQALFGVRSQKSQGHESNQEN